MKSKRVLIGGLLFLWSIILLLSCEKTNVAQKPGLPVPKSAKNVVEYAGTPKSKSLSVNKHERSTQL